MDKVASLEWGRVQWPVDMGQAELCCLCSVVGVQQGREGEDQGLGQRLAGKQWTWPCLSAAALVCWGLCYRTS